jgi:uncharacterized membrane protein YdjX (TVP38/TMEM64 family)
MEQEEPSFFEESRQQIEQYIQDRLLLLKLETAEKIARLGGLLFTGLVLALLSFFVLLFLSIMGGYFFASLTGSLYAGFGIIAGFYLFLFVMIIWFGKTWIEKTVADEIIKIVFEKEKEEFNEANNN